MGAKISEARVRKRKVIGQLWVILEAQELRVHLKPELGCQTLLPLPGQQQSSSPHLAVPMLPTLLSASSCSPAKPGCKQQHPCVLRGQKAESLLEGAGPLRGPWSRGRKLLRGLGSPARLGRVLKLQVGFKLVSRRRWSPAGLHDGVGESCRRTPTF